MYKKFFKRFFDITFSFFALLFLSIPMLIIALAVKIDSKGPVIFKTERVGVDSKPFKFYKFRSMKIDAPKDVAPMLLESDKYITKVGKFLRKSSLDELPQLFCILSGSMSLIGPRPSGFSEEELNQMRHDAGVDKLRPGLTGWAQINGRDVTAADIEKKVALDKEYLEKMSFGMDFKIFFKTIGKIFVSDGVVEGTEAAVLAQQDTEGLAGEVASDVVSSEDQSSESAIDGSKECENSIEEDLVCGERAGEQEVQDQANCPEDTDIDRQ